MLNRQKFEWNHSDFNQLFQSTETAVDFVTVFQEVARFDSERGYFVPKPQSATQTTRPAYNEENKDDPWLSIGYRGKGSQSFLVSLDGPHLLALDHDFHVHGVVPSVAFFVNTPEKAIDSFFDGQVFVTNKDKVTQTSSALRHATELTNLVRTHYSSSWFLLVTGAPTIV